MIITCPDCSTHYTVDAKTLGQSGRKVRCASCGHDWFATPEAEEVSPAADTEEHHDQPMQDDPVGDETQDKAPETTEEAGGDEDANTASSVDEVPPEETVPEGDQTEASEPEEDQVEAPEPEAKPTPAHRAYRNKLEARAKRRRLVIGLGAWGGVAAALVLIFALIVLNRTSVVRMIPKTAGTFAAIGLPVNIWGVDLKDIKSERVRDKGEDVLRISGQLYNTGDTPRTAPLVRISMRDETDEEIHAWTVPVSLATIPPKTGAQFITVVRNPPSRAVDLRFSLTATAMETEKKPKGKARAHESGH